VVLAVLLILEIVRQAWHVGAGPVPGSFPVDRCLGWILRRVGRALRPLLCARVERAAGQEAAAAVSEVLDPFLASPPSATSTPADRLAAAVVFVRPRLETPTPHRSLRSARSVERSAFDLALASRRLEAGPPSIQIELDRLNRPYDNVRYLWVYYNRI